jgi:hypothetical protein
MLLDKSLLPHPYLGHVLLVEPASSTPELLALVRVIELSRAAVCRLAL